MNEIFAAIFTITIAFSLLGVQEAIKDLKPNKDELKLNIEMKRIQLELLRKGQCVIE